MDLKLRSIDALLDWYPTAGNFRVTGGIVYNRDKFDAVGRPNAAGNFVLNGTTYSGAAVGTVNGTCAAFATDLAAENKSLRVAPVQAGGAVRLRERGNAPEP